MLLSNATLTLRILPLEIKWKSLSSRLSTCKSFLKGAKIQHSKTPKCQTIVSSLSRRWCAFMAIGSRFAKRMPERWDSSFLWIHLSCLICSSSTAKVCFQSTPKEVHAWNVETRGLSLPVEQAWDLNLNLRISSFTRCVSTFLAACNLHFKFPCLISTKSFKELPTKGFFFVSLLHTTFFSVSVVGLLVYWLGQTSNI